ncbi:MAG: GIY-YIG nuclease family protein [Selenomonadaceae bacterium]|nr:GIY-YIG nuclease family protein [Selenomonadaceae bacterium]
MKVYGVVYLVWNMVNGRRYVGQTTRKVEERFKEHACGKKYLIGKAIRKYGKENFRYGVIKSCASKEELNAQEIYFIAALHCKAPYGYNCTDGGECGNGRIILKEMRDNMSAAQIKRFKDPNEHTKISLALSGAKHPNFGKHRTDESRAKMSESKIGHEVSDRTRLKISKAFRKTSPYKNLITELDAHKLSYAALAKLMDFSQASVSRKVSGIRKFTDAEKAKLEEIFGKSAEYLLERTEL